MARLPDVDPIAHPDIAEAFRRTEESRGYVSNLMAVIAHAPEVQKAYAALGHQLRFHTQLTEVQRELAICATVRGVPYGWAHHGPLLQQLGFSDAQMAALKAGDVPTGLSAADQALCRFVFHYATLQGVPEDVLAGVRQHFTDRQVVEIGMLSSFYLAAGGVILAFDPVIETKQQLQRERAWQHIRPGAGT